MRLATCLSCRGWPSRTVIAAGANAVAQFGCGLVDEARFGDWGRCGSPLHDESVSGSKLEHSLSESHRYQTHIDTAGTYARTHPPLLPFFRPVHGREVDE